MSAPRNTSQSSKFMNRTTLHRSEDPTSGMPGNFPADSLDTTSSGGSGGRLAGNQAWSAKSQRGLSFPTRPQEVPGLAQETNEMGLIDQSTSGIDLENEKLDAMQGKDFDPNAKVPREENWGVEEGAQRDY